MGDLLRFDWTLWDDERRLENFTQWLRRRQRWRDTHSDPLPGLFARDRCALVSLPVPADLVEGERAGSAVRVQLHG